MTTAHDLIVQQPSAAARQLVLLFHGVGADADDLVPLGRRLARAFPQAWVVSIGAPHDGDFGCGRQWFSVQGITEDNRPVRVAAALPLFLATVQDWQARTGQGVEATALIGFSQGAIMALEASLGGPPVAGRVVAIAGRFARLPAAAPQGSTLHFIHGKADGIIPYGNAVAAAERLVALGADLTADVLPFVGHEVNAEVAELVVERLQGYLPRRRWDEALRADPDRGPEGL